MVLLMFELNLDPVIDEQRSASCSLKLATNGVALCKSPCFTQLCSSLLHRRMWLPINTPPLPPSGPDCSVLLFKLSQQVLEDIFIGRSVPHAQYTCRRLHDSAQCLQL